MRWSRLRSPLARNVLAAVVSWIGVMVALLIAVGGLVLLAGPLVFARAPGWVFAFVGIASLAILFGAGFVCSRLAASRAGVWFLIALLLLPNLLRGRWGASISLFGPGLGINDWGGLLAGLVVLPVAIAFVWLVTILPVLAGANFERNRRLAVR